MGKPHYYQKVINSQPLLFFVYGVARFELLIGNICANYVERFEIQGILFVYCVLLATT